MLALATLCVLAGCTAERRTPAPVPSPSAAALPTSGAWLASAPNLRTLASAARASGVAATLEGAGPFTVFAPTDTAFGRLPPGAIAALLAPENHDVLVRLLTFHVVAGALSAEDLRARVAAGGGSATLATVEGEPLTLTITGGFLTLTDADGDRSYVETGDLHQANGVVHVVNGVLVPRLD